MSSCFQIKTASSRQWAGAFELVFRHLPPDERSVRILNAIDLVERGEMNREGIFVAYSGRQIAGAVVCLPVPGAAAIVWPPRAASRPESQAIEDALVRHATGWLRRQGAKLAQALHSEEDRWLAEPLLRNGFTRPTSLLYMRRDLKALSAQAFDLDMEPYSSCDQVVFKQTLERTYIDTLDCPEINGVRTLEEALASHRSQGIHDPSRWWLARTEAEPIGVLLLTEVPEWFGWDLSYIGIVPDARRRGFGTQLTRIALLEAERAGANEITLSVDERNQRAYEMYCRLGFKAFDRREVYLAVWPAGETS
jgi:ribosomal protein S18 acetylase RimI-like enzyme